MPLTKTITTVPQLGELASSYFNLIGSITIGGSVSSIDDGCFPSLTHNY